MYDRNASAYRGVGEVVGARFGVQVVHGLCDALGRHAVLPVWVRTSWSNSVVPVGTPQRQNKPCGVALVAVFMKRTVEIGLHGVGQRIRHWQCVRCAHGGVVQAVKIKHWTVQLELRSRKYLQDLPHRVNARNENISQPRAHSDWYYYALFSAWLGTIDSERPKATRNSSTSSS